MSEQGLSTLEEHKKYCRGLYGTQKRGRNIVACVYITVFETTLTYDSEHKGKS